MIKKELEIINKSVDSITKIEELNIIDSKSLISAVDLLDKINKYLDSVIKYKESKTKPLNEALKIIRAETKPLETRLENMVTILKAKMGAFQTEQLRLQRIEEDKIAKKLDSGYIKAETAINKMEALDVVQSKVATDVGSVSFREEKDFEVVDISKVPAKYLLPNMVDIRIAMKAGIELPGVRYFTKQVITNRKK